MGGACWGCNLALKILGEGESGLGWMGAGHEGFSGGETVTQITPHTLMRKSRAGEGSCLVTQPVDSGGEKRVWLEMEGWRGRCGAEGCFRGHTIGVRRDQYLLLGQYKKDWEGKTRVGGVWLGQASTL